MDGLKILDMPPISPYLLEQEEYREIKDYYDKRFLKLFGCIWIDNKLMPSPELQQENVQTIAFRNGYSKTAPMLIAKCELKVGQGREEWGVEPGKQYYILVIKEVLDEQKAII